MNGVSAFSLVLGIFSFIIAFLLYYSQTLNGKRICWYHTSKGKRSWLLVFNTSRRLIIPKDIFKQLNFSNKSIIHHDLLETKKIVGPSLKEDGDNVLIDFQFMEPSSYMIIELQPWFSEAVRQGVRHSVFPAHKNMKLF